MNESEIAALINQALVEQSTSTSYDDLKLLLITLTLKIAAAMIGIISFRWILSKFDSNLDFNFKEFFSKLSEDQKLSYIKIRYVAAALIIAAAII